jgi:hypothetical protein
MRLLDSLAEPARGEMYFTPMTLGRIIAEPVLQEWGADLRGI